MDPTSDEIDNAASFMKDEEKRIRKISYLTKEEYINQIQVESILFYDAVQLFSKGFDYLNSNSKEKIYTERLFCKDPKEWRDGLNLAIFLKRVKCQRDSFDKLF